jgi:hypothetical protein
MIYREFISCHTLLIETPAITQRKKLEAREFTRIPLTACWAACIYFVEPEEFIGLCLLD